MISETPPFLTIIPYFKVRRTFLAP